MKKIIILLALLMLPIASALELGKLTQTELDKMNITAEDFHCGYIRGSHHWNYFGLFSFKILKSPFSMTATAGCYRIFPDGENYIVKDDLSPFNLKFTTVLSCLLSKTSSQCMGGEFSTFYNNELDRFEDLVKARARSYQTQTEPFIILENQLTNIRWR